ncbi:MAG: glucokinase, partial [bacterium]
ERVLSGPGLLNIYRFLAARPGARENDAVRAEVSRDGPVAITRHGVAATDLLCAQSLDVFAAAFGAEAGDLALTVLATGGVYVAGGIAPAILPWLREGAFLAAFRDKGRMGDMLSRVPVHVVMNTNVGLIGAAVAATGPGMLAGAAASAQPLSHETSGTP